MLGKRVAVVFAGAGVYDGTEIHEATSVLIHLSRAKAITSIFAPDRAQMHVVDHIKGTPTMETRNVLTESARIARGNIKPLSDLDVTQHDAVIFPGGFGAAKNLCNFATEGAAMTVQSDVQKVITSFHSANKPIGLCCIAPILVAKAIPGVSVTLGKEDSEGGRFPHCGATGAAKALGAIHVPKDVNDICVDVKNKIVTTPAYMCDTAVHEVYDGIGMMVAEVVKLA
jgi:enhancing lycopene biosynthesis protein 2